MLRLYESIKPMIFFPNETVLIVHTFYYNNYIEKLYKIISYYYDQSI